MEEIVHNLVRMDGMCELKLMSDAALTEAQVLRYVPVGVRALAQVKCYDTAALSLFYGEAVYPCREVVRCQVSCIPSKFRKLAVWKLLPGEHVSVVIGEMAMWYFASAHRRAKFAFIKRLPKGAENGMEIAGLMLLEAEWALTGCVMVGG